MVALALFERVATLYADAIRADLAVLGPSSSGAAAFYIRDFVQFDNFTKATGLTDDEVSSVRREVLDTLTAHGAGVSADRFVTAVRSRAESSTSSGVAVQRTDDVALRAQFELCGELFDTSHYRQQAWTKYTSKQPNFHRFDWEITEKWVDDDDERPEGPPSPFATVRITSLDLRASDSRIMAVFTLDAFDLLYLESGIERLRAALRARSGTDTASDSTEDSMSSSGTPDDV